MLLSLSLPRIQAQRNLSISTLAVFAALAGSAAPTLAAPSVPVTVTNTPNVNATITNPSLTVRNTAATPLFVDDSQSARNGFNATCTTDPIDPANGQASCELVSVPGGSRMVIESVSCQAVLAAGQGPADVQLIVPTLLPNGSIVSVSHLLAMSKQAGNASLDIWRVTTSLKAYATAYPTTAVGVGAFFRATYNASISSSMICTISGYQVN